MTNDTRAPGFDIGRAIVWSVVVAVVAAAVGAAWWLPSRTPAPAPAPPVAGEWSDEGGPAPDPTTGLFPAAAGTWLDVPAVERSGLPLRTKDLGGRFLVVDFVFKDCGGTCPVLQAAMTKVQAATSADDDLRLVSITVNPKADTPEVLAAWADALGADRSRWLFLRIEEAEARRFMKDGLRIPTAEQLIAHSNLLLLVDPDGAVRGRYAPIDHATWLEVLLADLRALRAERAPR